MADSPTLSDLGSRPGAGSHENRDGPSPGSGKDPAKLRSDFHAQTARIAFMHLQRPFAAGRVVLVSDSLDLVEVAVELAVDNATRFQAWIGEGSIIAVSDGQAADWLEADTLLWAVVANPWVLVQLRADAT